MEPVAERALLGRVKTLLKAQKLHSPLARAGHDGMPNAAVLISTRREDDYSSRFHRVMESVDIGDDEDGVI